MKLFGLDFETTGLDVEKDVVTEVGCVLWDTERHIPLLMDNFFVYHDEPKLSEEAAKATGITQQDLNDYGLKTDVAFHRMMDAACQADAVVAHYGNSFDKPIALNWGKRVLGEDSRILSRLPWIDTTMDVEFSDDITTRKLSYLAAEHGFLNPFSHRALFDVLTMMIVLDKYDLEPILFSASQPIVTVRAKVSYDDRQLAKDHKFYWEPDRKLWLKEMKLHKAQAANFPFKASILHEET